MLASKQRCDHLRVASFAAFARIVYFVGERDEPLGEDGQLGALEEAHLAAFSAFRRSPEGADHELAPELAASLLHSRLNPGLARCVYANERGRFYIVPGPGAVCFVSVAASTGQTVTGHTTIDLAMAGVLGHHGGRRGDPGLTCVGVLPAGGHDLRIIDLAGRETRVPLTSDDAYWVTVADPIEIVWTDSAGKDRHVPFAVWESFPGATGSAA